MVLTYQYALYPQCIFISPQLFYKDF